MAGSDVGATASDSDPTARDGAGSGASTWSLLFGNRDGSGTGRIRLDGELTGFRAELEGLADECPDEQRHRVERGRKLLADAEAALEDGDIEQGWYYLHAARRLTVYDLRVASGDGARDENELIRAEARELLVEATNAPESWRTDAVRARLADGDRTPREGLSTRDLRAARELLDEGYQRIHLKRHHLQEQLRHLRRVAALSVIGFLLVALWSSLNISVPAPADPFVNPSQNVVPSPLVQIATGTDGSSGDTSAVPPGFLIYVVLSGVLGASLFGIRSLRSMPTSSSTPQHLSGRGTTLARAVVGAGSALAVFFFLQSNLLTVGGGVEENRAAFLIAVAFVAGYSQRLVHTTVETVAGITEPDGSDDEES